MPEWQYVSTFVYANIDNPGAKEYIKQAHPNYTPEKFSPRTMEPHLNDFGKDGWELVHMEPIQGVGRREEVYYRGGEGRIYSNVYFCVFKRPAEE